MASKWARKTELVKMARELERFEKLGQSDREKEAHNGRRSWEKLNKHYNKCRKNWGFENEKSFLSHLTNWA